MRRQRSRVVAVRLAIAVGLAGWLLSAVPMGAAAQVEEPRDAVAWELLGGTLGGALFGVGGGYLAAVSCLADAQGLGALACIVAAMLGYVAGLPVGVTLGVNAVGSLSGVQGNVLLSALGAVLGEAAGLGLVALVSNAMGDLPEAVGWTLILGAVPFLSSVGATLGYNVGARMASPQARTRAWPKSQALSALATQTLSP